MASETRRWNTDRRGQGVADGGWIIDDVRQLLAALEEPHWIAEDPHAHLLPYLQSACDAAGTPWTLQCAGIEAGVYIVSLRWSHSSGRLGQLRADAVALLRPRRRRRPLAAERARPEHAQEQVGGERMAANGSPIKQLQKEGQSLWLDNIRRQLITSGELARLRDEGVTGVTSNPTIFEKAVSGSTDYDEGMVRLVRKGRRPDEMLWDLMVEDIQAAADVFRPVYERTRGADGFVSIEVSPVAAPSTKKTNALAQELHDRCGRPNVMGKLPSTKPGLPAIR